MIIGVTVYAAGQIISKLFIEPIYEQRTCIGAITNALILYAREYSSPDADRTDEAAIAFRDVAATLMARTGGVPWYGLFAILRVVRKQADIRIAHADLIGLSNAVQQGDRRENGNWWNENNKSRKEIETVLGISTGIGR